MQGARSVGTLVAACIFFLFFDIKLSNPFSSHGASKSGRTSVGSSQTLPWHPIPRLMSSAEANFTNMISRQSKTLHEAVSEYRRRYNRDPPKGFDDWFAFAIESDAKIIDEYDNMVKEFSPFWNITGKELRQRALHVGLYPSIDLVRIENGKSVLLNITKKYMALNDKERNARARGFQTMIKKFEHKLPDMDFAINTKAEGRILVPWEHKMFPELASQEMSERSPMDADDFTPSWQNDGNVWSEFVRTCPPSSPARRLFGSLRGSSLNLGNPPAQKFLHHTAGNLLSEDESSDFDFALNTDHDFDFCSSKWARYQQGHFFSDWRTISGLYPLFSHSKTPGFSDILIPSNYYITNTTRYTYGWDPKAKVILDVDKMEVDWENKTDKIFWRGATTGGGSTPAGHITSYQRHRFIEMSAGKSNASKTIIFPNPHTSEMVKVELPIKQLNNEIMDTGFTRALGCLSFPGGCKGMQDYYHFTDTKPLGECWRHKYLVDVDGMGYSARVMALLASKSALIKATVYREYYTDWIQPWLHYIPLSQTYNELYNIHAFFSGPSSSTLKVANIPSANITNTSENDLLLKRIASAGREWQRTIGRKADMEVYVYRLCLEYARLWADDREAMAYTASGAP